VTFFTERGEKPEIRHRALFGVLEGDFTGERTQRSI
jgi:hypothetical protein